MRRRSGRWSFAPDRRYHAARENCASWQARGRSRHTGPETSAPARGVVWASGFFSERLGQHVLVQREVRHQALQTGVLVLELPQRRTSLTPRCANFFFQV